MSSDSWTKMNMAHPIPNTLQVQGFRDASKQATHKIESAITAFGPPCMTTRLIAWVSACFAIVVCFHGKNLRQSST